MLRTLYSLLIYLLTPLIFLRLFWRGFKAPEYWQRWHERLGFVNITPGCIWIHAVSVGEFQAALPLIQQLKQHFPHTPLLITTMTVTGSQRVHATFGNSVQHCYLPYDLPGSTARFLHRVQPKLLILMETELWLNLLHHCHRHHVPVILANARLSERSARGYQRIAPIFHEITNKINYIAAQTPADAQRFIQLGVEAEKVQVIGNIKFDAKLPPDLTEQTQQLRQFLGTERKIWIAASTHEGEEIQVLTAFAKIQAQLPEILLILVPRHPERFDKVAILCEKSNYLISRRSQNQPCTKHTQIYLGDTMGELILLYSVSKVAFIGGSLVPIGGHNMLEAAAVGIPSIFGQHVFNFTEIAQNLLAVEAAKQVTDVDQLATTVLDYLQHPESIQHAGQRGLNFIQQNQGAVAKLLEIITTFLKSTH